MRIGNELWQGYFGYWQNRFIHHNILTIGYTAWDGYMNVGKGMVVCDVVDAIPLFIDWSVDAVTFNQAFVPQGQVVSYLQAMEVKKYVVSALYKAIATYDPTQAIVILIVGNSTVDINLLQNLGIPLAECYKQVQQRRVEFQPALTTVPRRDL